MESVRNTIPQAIYDSLVNAGKGLSFLLSCTKFELAQIANSDLDTAESVIKTVSDSVGLRLLTVNLIPDWKRISTGCSAIDGITKGGIPINGITEIFGFSGVGKTQFCLQLSLMAQLSQKDGGTNKGVVYICTEDVFPAKRLQQLTLNYSNKYNQDFQDNVFIQHCANFEELKRCLATHLPKLLLAKPVGLLIIDSIAGLFRAENENVNYVNRSQEFTWLVSYLQKLSSKFEFAVVCVNQVSDNIQEGKTEPCLGLAWGNLLTCRFTINRFTYNTEREFEIVFAPDLPLMSAKFIITEKGLF